MTMTRMISPELGNDFKLMMNRVSESYDCDGDDKIATRRRLEGKGRRAKFHYIYFLFLTYYEFFPKQTKTPTNITASRI